MKKYHYTFNIGVAVYKSVGGGKSFMSDACKLSGVPFSGDIYADNEDEAKERAKAIAEEVADNMFNGNHNFFNTFVCEIINAPHINQSLSVLSCNVHEATIANIGNGHDASLVKCLNLIYGCDNTHVEEKFHEIFKLLWNRDRKELANKFDTECVWWQADEASFEEMVEHVGLEEMLYTYYHYVADDEDIRTTIAFVRPPKEVTNGFEWWTFFK